MTASAASQITAMKNQTAFANAKSERTTGLKNDSNTFLTLMLKQMENQDQMISLQMDIKHYTLPEWEIKY